MISINNMVRGAWCEHCKRMVYENIYGHAAMHRRELEERSKAEAIRRSSAEAIEIMRRGRCK